MYTADYLSQVANRVYKKLEDGEKVTSTEFESGCMALFFPIDANWGLKLYREIGYARSAMMRHLYLLDMDLAPNMGTELFTINVAGRERYGYLNGMCNEAHVLPGDIRESEWEVLKNKYIQAGLKELLFDVWSSGLNWGFRRTDKVSVIYDFMTWDAPKWLDNKAVAEMD